MQMTVSRILQSGVIACAIGLAFLLCVRLRAQAGKADDTFQGFAITVTGTAAGAVACVRCHGFDGNSDGSGAFPAIVGQSEFYLQKQLRDFASGSRRNAIMSPIAARLTPDELAAVARYYSRLGAHQVTWDPSPASLIERGMELATTGNDAERVQACQNCHGPNGRGEPPDVPRLAGQYAHYLAIQLQMWRRGYRKNDPGSLMQAPAHNLNEQDISAVAANFSQLPIPNSQLGGPSNAR
jgi:cytochrome c553